MQDRREFFGKAVREAREAAGFSSRAALARAVGIGERTVAAVELAERRGGGRKARGAIARVLGWNPMDVEDYIDGRTNALPSPSLRVDPSDHATDDPVAMILDASLSDLFDMCRTVEADPRYGALGAERWLVRALELRDRARQRTEVAKSDAP